MKILTFSDLWVPFPGGAEKMMYNISLGLKNLGNEVIIFSGYNRSADGIKHPMPYEEDGVFKVYMRSIPVNKEVKLGEVIVKEVLDLVKPDVVLSHAFFAGQFSTFIKSLGYPIVKVVHNGDRGDSDIALFNSQFTYDFKGGQKRTDQQPQDMAFLPPIYDDMVAETHGDKIGFVKPIGHKGIDFLYKIASAMPDKKFLVLRGEWQTLETIKEMPNVEFMNPVVDIRDFYKEIRILLTPSLYEDAGIVPSEAHKNGIPCISSNVMGLNETNKAGIRLPFNLMDWVAEINKLDDPVYYKEISDRELADINSRDWNVQLKVLNEKMLCLKK